MSTDWSKYSTAEESRLRNPRPEQCGIARLGVAAVRAIGPSVAHTPRDKNQAHSDVTGIGDDEEVRLKLAEMAEMVLKPGP